MSLKKVSVYLDPVQVATIEKLVASRKTESVSAFVKHAVEVSLADVDGWGAMLGRALDATGGPLTRQERAWADAILKAGSKGRRKKAA